MIFHKDSRTIDLDYGHIIMGIERKSRGNYDLYILIKKEGKFEVDSIFTGDVMVVDRGSFVSTSRGFPMLLVEVPDR
ncbi:hypothetical protein D1T48_gp31 [Thermoproteus tenax virus 1]|uniref:Uncharacterized 8.8 kDa protein n=1 Tax=Thermoproteus tenax virus 1 (strain KRA1) TaxID=10480 RepID=YORS_TTV1K|nr:hypothetical protein D1T48_gp31 [Thermoproteus tenax virus 1]P19303.1 RecName: Full=Uncharacterized 8.8 kDa protein [Thermoproteus tenax virus 1 (STRAIN KRA1)]CAA32999.1 unnamed protein product [Thermoproteus tenax virus 1]